MKRIILLSFCLLSLLGLQAQELLVRRVEKDGADISASTQRRMDRGGNPCALLKLQVVDQLVAVEGAEMIGDMQRFGTTTWVYVPYGTEHVTLLFENHAPLTINFANYGLEPLQRLTTYVLTLVDAAATADPNHPTDAVAQYELGCDYAYGRNGRPMSESVAVGWFEKAAAQGHEMSQTILGTRSYKMYQINDDQKCFDEAVAWWEKAANQGLVLALWNLAKAYAENATEENSDVYHPKAAFWAEKAANQGHTSAMEMLGELYTPGYFEYSVKPDIQKAIYWLTKASEKGSNSASYRLGEIYQKGFGVEKDKQKARQWYEKAANQGSSGAKIRLKDADLQ